MCRTFYISSRRGNDQNDGCSAETAFKTLHRMNREDLTAGTRILLERGSVFFEEYLQIRQSGTEDNPIIIDAYHDGDDPIIHTESQGLWYQNYGTPLDSPTHLSEAYVSSAILLYDACFVHIKNLELTNRSKDIIGEEYSSAHKLNKTGISVIAKDRGVVCGLRISNVYIHDVHGNVYDKHLNNGGICFAALKPCDETLAEAARFRDIVISDCMIQNVSRWGIFVGYTYLHAKFSDTYLDANIYHRFGHEKISIVNNYVKQIGGDGICVMYALNPLVEHNIADSVAMEMNDSVYTMPKDRQGKVAAGIWPWKCKNALFRYNLVRDTKLNQDGMAYDADSGDGTIYEYNYSRQNEGGCIMFCLEQSVNNIFRHNVSFDDLGGLISPTGNPDARIEHNRFIKRKSTPLFRKNMDDGKYELLDNEIIEMG